MNGGSSAYPSIYVGNQWGPQWSPPVNGGSSSSLADLFDQLHEAAMEPAGERREQPDSTRLRCVNRPAAMEPAGERREQGAASDPTRA